MAPDGSRRIAGFRSTRGSVMLVSLCLMTTLGISLASYLALSMRSAQASTRLMHQENAQQLAQVGLEEALWALNQNAWTTSGPAGSVAWTTTGADRTVTLSYTLSTPGATGAVTLAVANYASTGPTWPSITSTATVILQGGETFTKSIQATTGTAPVFGNAIASIDSYVSFVQGGVIDSWNSNPDNNPATPAVAYSFTAGNATNYAAVIAARGDGTTSVQLSQAEVRGYVATCGLPISYSTSGSPPAKILGPATTAGVNVDVARLGKSAFVPSTDVFPIVVPTPNHGGGLVPHILALVNMILASPNSTDVFETGSLTINGGLLNLFDPNMTVDRPIKLIVDGDFTIENVGRMTVTSTGSVAIYVTGDVTIGGNGILNETLDPAKVAIFCTSTSTSDSVEYNTPEGFCGVIYSANKPIEIRQNATFHGALLSRQYVKFRDSATSPVFHYDIALRQTRFTGITTPYVVKTVTDL